MKNKKVLALALVGVLSLSALAPAALAADTASESETAVEETQKTRSKHGKGEKVAAPENAIGKDAAKAKALADAGVTAEGKVKSRVSQLDDGTVVYKVRFTCDGQHYSYQIDALTGAVVDKSVKEVTEDAAESAKHHKRGKHGKTAEQAAETASEQSATNA